MPEAAETETKAKKEDSAPAPDTKRKRDSVSSSVDDASGDDNKKPGDAHNIAGPGKKKTKQLKFSKLGRRGDARMHKAVAARLANPDMSLLGALQAGGFVFPALGPDAVDKGGGEDTSIFDTENVTLSQRKNQLSRRLRVARQKGTGGDKAAFGEGVAAESASSAGVGNGRKRSKKKKERSKDKAPMSSIEQANAMLTPEAQRQMHILMRDNPQLMTLQGNVDPMDSNASAAEQYRRMLSLASAGGGGSCPGNVPAFRPGAAPVAGLPGSAPEVIMEDANVDPTAAAETSQTRKARDHPMFAQYQASVLNNPAHWGGLQGVMATVAANQAAANAGLAALGAAAGAQMAHQAQGGSQGALAQAQAQALAGAAAIQQASLGMGGSPLAHMGAAAYQQNLGSCNTGASQSSSAGAPGDAGAGAGAAPAVGASKDTASAKASAAAPSGGAPDSLAVTAASLGMSREQLALMMGQGGAAKKSEEKKDSSAADPSNELAAAVADEEAAIDETKIRIALDVYRTEHATLLKRCLLIAGIEPSKTEECDPLYLKFAERAAEVEQKRLHRISSCFQGRHVHRLDGKCGHKAVMHHPPGDDKPHIDFIVDGKVECYKGIAGIKSVDNEAMWPSKFVCDDLSCTDEKGDHKHGDVTCGKSKCDKECSEATKQIQPAILYLSEKDMESQSEWNMITDGLLDDSALGLVELHDEPKNDYKDRSDIV